MSPPPSPLRDPRLDFFRGLALICIFIDHTPGNRLAAYTVGNLGFSDASEMFVLISAFTAGLVYMPRTLRDGLVVASRRIFRRAAVVYMAHLLLLGTMTILAGWLARTLRDPQFVNGLNVRPLLERPLETLPGALMLTFQPVFMNILPLYVVLLLALPAVLWLIRRHVGLALVVSFLVYAAARLAPYRLGEGTLAPLWAFNPLSWQLLFVVGVSLGAAGSGVGLRVPRDRWVMLAALVYVVGVLSIGPAKWSLDGSMANLPAWADRLLFPVMERPNLSLWRLVHIFALAYLVSYFVSASHVLFTSGPARALILCGRHSLTLFCVGVVLSVLGWVAIVRMGAGGPVQLLVNVSGILTLVAAAWVSSQVSGWVSSWRARGRQAYGA